MRGDDSPIELGPGLTLTAPGMFGEVAVVRPAEVPNRADPAGLLFEHALGNAGLTRNGSPVVLTHTSAADADVWITAPPVPTGNAAMLLVQDSSGAVSLHGPTPAAAPAGAVPGSSAAGHTFSVGRSRFGLESGRRGHLAALAEMVRRDLFHPRVDGAQKVLCVLTYPVAHLADLGAAAWIERWDRNTHPTVVRWFPQKAGQSAGQSLSPTNWHELRSDHGSCLLFVHGIFSSCTSAFAELAGDEQLWRGLDPKYQGRVIGFDHPTACVDPTQNARDFLEQIPGDVELELDVVCHSRGGLVARALAGQTGLPEALTSKVRVNRVVFAATPNAGSPIVLPGDWEPLVSRLATLLTLPTKVLPLPVDEVTAVLAGILEVAKIAAARTELALPGLADMAPVGDFMAALSEWPGSTPDYFAAAAQFVPGPLVSHLFRRLDDEARVVDDLVFSGGDNDIAVPTDGVWAPVATSGQPVAGFPVLPDRRYALGPGDTYWHCNYFADGGLRERIARWLTDPL